jgi:hypothetical protein
VSHRPAWLWLPFGLWLAVLATTTSCMRYVRSGSPDTTGTCEGACEHYVDCKRSDSEAMRGTCLAECREIFVYQGEPDRESLEQFEELECEAAVAFVDGDSGRKSRTDERGVRRSQSQR